MGDGKNLKKYLDEKGTNVRKIAKATGISATTLYSIIQKDSNIRFDFALRLANELQIDVNEICSASPFSGTIKEEEIYPTLPDGLNGALDASRVKTYLKNSMYPLMYLFGKNSMPDVDNLLTSFYQLDDESRQEVVETIRIIVIRNVLNRSNRSKAGKKITPVNSKHSQEFLFGTVLAPLALFFNFKFIRISSC